MQSPFWVNMLRGDRFELFPLRLRRKYTRESFPLCPSHVPLRRQFPPTGQVELELFLWVNNHTGHFGSVLFGPSAE